MNNSRRAWLIVLGGAILTGLALLIDTPLTAWATSEPTRRVLEKLIDLPLAIGIYAVVVGILASFPTTTA